MNEAKEAWSGISDALDVIRTLNSYIDRFNMDVRAWKPRVVTTMLADCAMVPERSEQQVHGRRATACSTGVEAKKWSLQAILKDPLTNSS